MNYKLANILLCYKNFAANRNISHIGLGVSALNTTKVLRSLGVKVDVLPILSAADLSAQLAKNPRTHVIISAPWIPTVDLQNLANEYPETYFAVVCHSNVGFLQADTNGVKLFREDIELESGTHNFHLAGNSRRFSQWVQDCFAAPCGLLPNLYFLDGHTPIHGPSWCPGQLLRIGAFGAIRPLKNFMSAAGAALEIARETRSPLEFWLSGGRSEGGGQTVLTAIEAMYAGLPGVSVKLNNWATWPQFRNLVGSMHLLLQPSYSESFNMVTADGIAKGVPSVVSDAITWVPEYWKADTDDVTQIARVGIHLLTYHNTVRDGLASLNKHNLLGCQAWGDTLHLEDLPSYHPQVKAVHQIP